jgi:predicted lipoprotein with Yx(FWY)xxD motif
VPAAIAVAIVGFIVLSAVAGSPSKDRRGGGAAPAVKVRKAKLGRILVNAEGRTLYLFLEDAGGKSSCYGPCTRVWPPALVTGATAKGGAGVIARKLKTVARRGSQRRQLVYNGHPLYTTDADAKPGDTNGQAVFNTWFAVSPAGKQVGKANPDAGGY